MGQQWYFDLNVEVVCMTYKKIKCFDSSSERMKSPYVIDVMHRIEILFEKRKREKSTRNSDACFRLEEVRNLNSVYPAVESAYPWSLWLPGTNVFKRKKGGRDWGEWKFATLVCDWKPPWCESGALGFGTTGRGGEGGIRKVTYN